MRNYSLEQQLCNAIKQHRVIRFKYKDEFHFRTFEPYIVYQSTKGKILIGGTQTKDDSEPFKGPWPHRFEVELMNNISVTEQNFTPDPQFSSNREDYQNGIVCAIDRIDRI